MDQQDDRAAGVLRAAEQLFEQRPQWVDFYRQLLGADGLIAREYASNAARTAFEATPEFSQVMALLGRLRGGGEQPRLAQRVITVRLPQDMHEALKAEARRYQQSLNWLCLQKLRQPLA